MDKYISEEIAKYMDYYISMGYVIFPPSSKWQNGVITENFKNGGEFGKIIGRAVEIKLEEWMQKEYAGETYEEE